MITKNKRQTVYTRQLAIRFTAGEWCKLEAEAERGGISRADFVRQCTGKGYAISEVGLSRLRVELNKIGSNVNQIAKKANQGGHSDDIYRDALQEIIELRQILVNFKKGKKW